MTLPITILLGIFTIISLFITIVFGILFHYFHKPVFRYHKIFAYLTAVLSIVHATLVIIRYYL